MSTTDKNYIISQIANIVNADANGAIVSLNTSSYTSNLGPVGNVTITGGSAGQALTTDGSGTLSWTTVTTNNVANANYAAYAGNVTIAAQSNITSVGTLSSLTVGGVSNLNTVGNLRITGGSNGQMLTTNGSGALSWATANVASSTQVGQFGLFLSSPPDSTWLPASTGPYLVSSYPALGALYVTYTVNSLGATNSIFASSSIDAFGFAYGDRFLAIGSDRTVRTMTTAGSTWTSAGTLPAPSAGAYSNPVWTGSAWFVATSFVSGPGQRSTDGGATWTSCTLPAAGVRWRNAVMFGSSILLLEGGSTTSPLVAKSNDNGSTWTTSTVPNNAAGYTAIGAGGGKVIVLAYGTNAGYYSTDAVTWTAFTLPITRNWTAAVHNGSYWVLGANGFDTTTCASYDGINWFTIPTATSSDWTGRLQWDGTRWIVVCPTINAVYYNTNPISKSWTTLSHGVSVLSGEYATSGTTLVLVQKPSNGGLSYRYTFTAASTFSVGSGPVSVSRGTWWIKS